MLGFQQRFEIAQARLEQRQFGEAAMTAAARARNQLAALTGLQTFGGGAAVGTGEAAGA